ncbi:hypothetical protein SAMN05444350_1448 [Bacteroides stercorirosoris]|uniref:Uncharacterized protein n=2 Tax=Bacteroides stercorirosoris TaxID=871324 RepID=A0A1M6L4D3_9BACE|nr:hypothetical protein SAMN05444350_1448 [Bacteroides stercorirosoris]
MINIELYINGALCDTGAAFGVRLNRQLLNPGELNTKDAQYSYSITLPPTANNHAIFNYANIEETKDKFNREYKAELIINSVRVFVGNFRLSEVSRTQYKGNLYIPAQKSIKDIFGEIKLNQNPEYRIVFKDFAEYVSYYNSRARSGPQMAIFPYTLYGLLPKVPLNLNGNAYSPRDIWDDSVRLSMQDLAPSINPLLMLKHIFNSQGYSLVGTAFDDERLTRLYMSYKNETDYVQPWNYGQQAYMSLRGYWSNVRGNYNIFERNGFRVDYDGLTYYNSDLLDATNTTISIDDIFDPGANILYKQVTDGNNRVWTQCQIRIPSSGFYKVRLKADLSIDSRENWRSGYDGMQFVGGDASDDPAANSFRKKRYEVKILRDHVTGDFGVSNGRINRVYYHDNLGQNDTWDEDNTPKYFPNPGYTASGKEREVMLVDPAENPNYVVGLAWGRRTGINNQNPLITNNERGDWGTVLAAKTGLSWDIKANPTTPAKIGIPSSGYMKWGKLGQFDDEDEDPNKNIDYSGGDWVNNMKLDDNGNVIEGEEGVTSIILKRFRLSANSQFQLTVPADAGYVGKIFLHSTELDSAPAVVYQFDENGIATFNSLNWSDWNPRSTYLTLYLAYDDGQVEGVNFDVSTSLVIDRIYDPEDIIDWEQTDKFKIDINNAPESYARRGWYKGAYVDNNWKADGEVNAIVWLQAGELLTVVSSSDEGRYKRNNSSGKYGWTKHEIDFEIDIVPFRIDEDWLTVNSAGNGTAVMDWNDPVNFDVDSINLVGFLPADVKTDDFIDNFCKAFNLRLSQIDAETFSLDVKQSKTAVSNLFINLDNLASVRDRSNQPLGLPSLYKLGFTVDVEEEGYVVSGDDGGGEFETGVTEEKVVEQKSNFSYNWFKQITKRQSNGDIILQLPVISKHEVWTAELSYPDAMAKRYTNQAARFWYYDGLLNDLGASFTFNSRDLSIAKVSNEIQGLSILNYKNQKLTILDNYFTLLINGSSHYTEVEGYLTPDQYEALNGSIMAMFNGDLYYVAELSGYDPSNRNKTKIKLIRKI